MALSSKHSICGAVGSVLLNFALEKDNGEKTNLPLSYSKSILEFICIQSPQPLLHLTTLLNTAMEDNSVNQDRQLRGAPETSQLSFSLPKVICFL